MRAVAMFSIPDGGTGRRFWDDRDIWVRMRDLGLERGRQRKLFANAIDNGLDGDDIRGALVDDVHTPLSLLTDDDRANAVQDIIYTSVVPGVHFASGRNIPFFLTRANGSDLGVQLFADELPVVLDAAEQLIERLTNEVDDQPGLQLASDIHVLDDRRTQPVVIGEQVGYGLRRRLRFAARRSAVPTPVAAAALVLGGAVLATSPLLHLPSDLGTPLIGAATLYSLGVATSVRKVSGIEWRLDYSRPNPGGEVKRFPRDARKALRRQEG